MAQDLFLGIIKKDWSRGAGLTPLPREPVQEQLILTTDEKAKLDKIATLKMKAESGDRRAKRQWGKLVKKANLLRKKAAFDPRARRMVAVLDQSGILGHVQKITGDIEPRDQDIIDKLILRAGNAAGWPVFLSKARYADYQDRAGKGDQRSKEVLAILDRYTKAGKLKISDDKKEQVTRYPIGASLCSDDLEAAIDGGNCERNALTRQIRT